MTEKEKKLRETEEFVRHVLSRDLKQKISAKKVRSVAIKVTKAIPRPVKQKEVA